MYDASKFALSTYQHPKRDSGPTLISQTFNGANT